MPTVRGCLDHAVEGDGPRPRLQLLRRRGEVLVGAVLIEVVVVEVDLFRRHRTLDREASGLGLAG